jgi:hypothetical protein
MTAYKTEYTRIEYSPPTPSSKSQNLFVTGIKLLKREINASLDW